MVEIIFHWQNYEGCSSADEESAPVDPQLVPTMKPLPDELQFGREMVLSVALEMEEKRRQMPKQAPDEIEQREDEDREEGEDQVEINHSFMGGPYVSWIE